MVRVLANNPGPFTLEGTNTWIVGERPSLVIDPGPDDETHLWAVAREAGDVAAILVTHAHPDHAPGADALSRRVSAPVMAFRPGPGQERLRDDQVVEADGVRLRAVHTPGHTVDHVVLWAVAQRALFTGDAVLGRGTSVVDPPEGDLAAYLRSLRRMQALAPRVLYPGHGPTVFDAAAKLNEYVDHRAMRERQVVEALRAGPRTPREIVPGIYQDYPPEMFPVAERQVLAHLLKLEREGSAERTGTGDGAAFELVGDRRCDRCGRPAMSRSRLCRSCSLDALQEPPEPPSGQEGLPEPESS
ncbi:MAG: MBL fold metallo-hydrolase [Actinomycetota bacterium]|nr:MBL fold metallo-hydrolase [Actinomycetota bacterium]